MQREVAAMVGFEAFKTEINRAVSMRMNGKQNSRGYKKAVRFLERYGLTGENAEHDFLLPGSYRIDDLPDNEVVSNQVKAAMLRFTNEAIFTPNPNDADVGAVALGQLDVPTQVVPTDDVTTNYRRAVRSEQGQRQATGLLANSRRWSGYGFSRRQGHRPVSWWRRPEKAQSSANAHSARLSQ